MLAKHTVDFKPDTSEHNFACHGDSTSTCHFYPDCECETWGAECEHEQVPHDECWMQTWFDNNGVDYSGDDRTERGFSSEPLEARSGEIDYEFEGDYIAWWWKA